MNFINQNKPAIFSKNIGSFFLEGKTLSDFAVHPPSRILGDCYAHLSLIENRQVKETGLLQASPETLLAPKQGILIAF